MNENTLIFIGLGKMGKNIITHALESNIYLKIFNRTQSVATEYINSLEQHSETMLLTNRIKTYLTFKELLQDTNSPRTIFLMVKAGSAVDAVINDLLEAGLTQGDTIIDGGNSWYEDSVRRNQELQLKGIEYIDCGTSGGLEGALYGACLMLGGNEAQVKSLSWLWDAITIRSPKAPSNFAGGSWEYLGPAGAGHFAKMVHNGIEYGMNQAIAEGFDLLSKSDYKYDLAKVSKTYASGSVIRGWLMELLLNAFTKDPRLVNYKGIIGGGETGSFVIKTAEKYQSPQPILEQAVKSRSESKTAPTFASKVVAALRFEYGGHLEPKD